MKKFVLKNQEINRTKPNLLILSLGWLLLVIISLFQHQLNFSIALFVLLYSVQFLFFRNSKDEDVTDFGDYYLRFENASLVCGRENTVYWHIPYTRLSHIGRITYNKNSIFQPSRENFYIFTNDNDSYGFPGAIDQEIFSEIDAEIKRVRQGITI